MRFDIENGSEEYFAFQTIVMEYLGCSSIYSEVMYLTFCVLFYDNIIYYRLDVPCVLYPRVFVDLFMFIETICYFKVIFIHIYESTSIVVDTIFSKWTNYFASCCFPMRLFKPPGIISSVCFDVTNLLFKFSKKLILYVFSYYFFFCLFFLVFARANKYINFYIFHFLGYFRWSSICIPDYSTLLNSFSVFFACFMFIISV